MQLAAETSANSRRPGFLDAHMHFWEYCLFSSLADLSTVSSWEELAEIMRAASRGEWRIGVRFNQETLPPGERWLPDRFILDRLFGCFPAMVVRTCLHLVAMNTAAMERLGVYAPRGVFVEADVFALLNRLVSRLEVEPGRLVAEGIKRLKSKGIAAVIDMNMDAEKLSFLELALALAAREGPNFGMDYFTSDFALLPDAMGYKIFLDGGLGAHTAALTEEYADDPGNCGVLNYSDEELLALVEKVHSQNKPVAVHAVGDRALDQFLRVMRVSRHPGDRVEHVQYARREQLEVLAREGIAVCIQPIFSREIAWAKDRLGPERMKTAYAWGLMREEGIYLLAGSDAPVDDADPYVGAAAAAAQTGSQHMSREEVLALYATRNWEYYWSNRGERNGRGAGELYGSSLLSRSGGLKTVGGADRNGS